ncbi:hypothetical protein HAX54_017979 [Datura stramonium]|uniref:Uncharacterized protein n=1 Tax=Datura stramonium TaxID=4076 RepID=A0ABS8UNS2_DATST|nr:hypothetical protein [Datura stramonium]
MQDDTILERSLHPLQDIIKSFHEVLSSLLEAMDARLSYLGKCANSFDILSLRANLEKTKVVILDLQKRERQPEESFSLLSHFEPVWSPTPSPPKGPTPPRVVGKMPLPIKADDSDSGDLQEEDDPDMDPTEAIKLRVDRLGSLAYARIKPYISSDTSTSSAPQSGFPAIILANVPHEPK